MFNAKEDSLGTKATAAGDTRSLTANLRLSLSQSHPGSTADSLVQPSLHLCPHLPWLMFSVKLPPHSFCNSSPRLQKDSPVKIAREAKRPVKQARLQIFTLPLLHIKPLSLVPRYLWQTICGASLPFPGDQADPGVIT